MDSTIKIYCTNLGENVETEGGTSLLEVSRTLGERLGFTPICARVNNKNESLSFQIFRPRTVEFLPKTSPSGERTYIRSLCMVLYRAVTRVAPEANLSIEHSISHGYYCRLGQSAACHAEGV